VPREEIVLFSNVLFHCPGGNVADAATDVNGATGFTGSIRAGGCTNNLLIFGDGVHIEQRFLPGLVPPASVVPVSTNSQDLLLASPGFVDAADLAALAARLGCPGPNCPPQSGYSICFDWNEDGSIDAAELSSLAAHLGIRCP
jgi:hypothetical protein